MCTVYTHTYTYTHICSGLRVSTALHAAILYRFIVYLLRSSLNLFITSPSDHNAEVNVNVT